MEIYKSKDQLNFVSNLLNNKTIELKLMSVICYGIVVNDVSLLSHFAFQNKPYPMDLRRLGHAIIVNNVSSHEGYEGSKADVAALKETYQTVGFDVQVHTDCNAKVCSAPIIFV